MKLHACLSRINLIKTLKISFGCIFAYLLAEYFHLSYSTSVITITLLSILNTRKETLKTAKSSSYGRYMAVNLENTFTVELRIFRGTLRYKTFVATLQFTDKLCNDAINLSDEEFQTMTWSDFVKSIKDMPELTEYLKIRGLEE